MSQQSASSACPVVHKPETCTSPDTPDLIEPDSPKLALLGNPEQPNTTEINAFVNLVVDVMRRLLAEQAEPATAVA